MRTMGCLKKRGRRGSDLEHDYPFRPAIILGGTQREKQEQWECGEMMDGLLQYSPGEKMAACSLSGGMPVQKRLVNGSPAHVPLFS